MDKTKILKKEKGNIMKGECNVALCFKWREK